MSPPRVSTSIAKPLIGVTSHVSSPSTTPLNPLEPLASLGRDQREQPFEPFEPLEPFEPINPLTPSLHDPRIPSTHTFPSQARYGALPGQLPAAKGALVYGFLLSQLDQ